MIMCTFLAAYDPYTYVYIRPLLQLHFSVMLLVTYIVYTYIYVDKSSCDNSINNGALIGAVVGVDCTVIIIMVITNIMVWIYCFRKRKNSGGYKLSYLCTL